MNVQQKNALMDAARQSMNIAIALVTAEVFSGLATAPALLISAAASIRATGSNGPEAAEAEQRANECPAILAIPWPFIYIGSVGWAVAVARLRDSLPSFIELESAARNRGPARETGAAVARANDRVAALSEAQRLALQHAGIKVETLHALALTLESKAEST